MICPINTSVALPTCGNTNYGAACSVAVKPLDLDPQGRWFDPRCGHAEMRQLLGPLS